MNLILNCFTFYENTYEAKEATVFCEMLKIC